MMAGPVLLAIAGVWLVLQVTAGRLPARLLSFRSAPIGANAPVAPAGTAPLGGDGTIAG